MTEMCSSNWSNGLAVCFASGMMILISFGGPFVLSDPLIFEHPNTPGIIATSFSWICFGLMGSREKLIGLLGDFDGEDDGETGTPSRASAA